MEAVQQVHVSEVFLELEKSEVGQAITATLDSVRVTAKEVLDTAWTMIRASVVGFLVGAFVAGVFLRPLLARLARLRRPIWQLR